MSFVRSISKISLVFMLVISTGFSCSTFYEAIGMETMLVEDAVAEVELAVLTGMLINFGSGKNESDTVLTLPFISSATGLDSKDTTSKYEKKKVEACAESILTFIVLTGSTNAGLIPASNCKLKKTP
ncbi:hypothetical protein AB3N59_03635 [Leptospira sp. WS92.C1]